MRDVGRNVTAAAFSAREPPADTRSWAEGVLADAVVAGRRAAKRHRHDRATPGICQESNDLTVPNPWQSGR